MKQQQKISRTFVLFLITSLFFWMLIKLSKKYTTVQSFDIAYINFPQNKLLQTAPLQKIKLDVFGTGFKLISAKLSEHKILVDASNLKHQKDNIYLLSLINQQQNIQNQLPNGLTIKNVYPQNIPLQLGYLDSKKVPVFPNFSINYKVGYDLVKRIKIEPDSVLLTGPKTIIDTISNIYLEHKNFKNVSKNISEELLLKLPKKEYNIKTNVKKVHIYATVEKFTEGSFDVPFKVINLPKDTKINTFPKSVKVVFKVSLKDFSAVHPEAFLIECDYRTTQKSELNYLVPKLINKSSLVKKVKIVPNKIEFLIQK